MKRYAVLLLISMQWCCNAGNFTYPFEDGSSLLFSNKKYSVIQDDSNNKVVFRDNATRKIEATFFNVTAFNVSLNEKYFAINQEPPIGFNSLDLCSFKNPTVVLAKYLKSQDIFWSPDGEHFVIAFGLINNNQNMKLYSIKDPEKALVKYSNVSYMYWSPDGEHFAIPFAPRSDNPEIRLYSIKDPEKVLMKYPKGLNISWAPDKNQFMIFTESKANSNKAELYDFSNYKIPKKTYKQADFVTWIANKKGFSPKIRHY